MRSPRHVHTPAAGPGWLLGFAALFAVSSCTGAGGEASQAAQASTVCPPVQLEGPRLLRQLSLDLRGAPPTEDELLAVLHDGVVAPATVDAMLADPRFLVQAQRWHADLLWPTLAGFYIHQGAMLVVTPGRGGQLASERSNPEGLVRTLDRRSAEPTCPPAGTEANLTAASCCTPADPNHPACCLVRNTSYNPDDPACVAKSRALPAVFDTGPTFGDRELRGGDTYLGCDPAVEYPPPRVAAGDARWPHDPDGRPYYTAVRSGSRRYYYDAQDIPLPYDSYNTCPNYCRTAVGSGPGGAFVRGDYSARVHTVAGVPVQGDAPDAVCPPGLVEVQNPCDNAVGPRLQSLVELRQEGAILMRPYWSGNHWIKVCAHESQERTQSLITGLPCTPNITEDTSCGCGPNGAWCTPANGSRVLPTRAEKLLRDALAQEPLQIIASVIASGEDYFTAFTTRRGMVNGALAFMYREQADRMQEIAFSAPAPREAIPELSFDDPTWHPYTRGPEHAGVLTTPAYLARFPTRRARINRFRSMFLCRPFVPPAGETVPPDDPCNREPNIARRCGCQACHASIEPLGAYWGRWAERNANYLDPTTYPVFDPTCATCALAGGVCPDHCRFYVTAPLDGVSALSRGQLESYLWRTSYEVPRIEQGPAALVAEALASGEMQDCTVSTLWARLLHRPMSDTEREQVLPGLVQAFESNRHDYRALVRAVVSTPAYRRID